MTHFVRIAMLSILVWPFFTSMPLKAQPKIELEEFSRGGLNNIIGLYHAGDSRMFAVLQSGQVRVVLEDGSVLPGAFINVSSLISTGGERGLLGMAFHPQYSENGYFYLNYTNRQGSTIVSRWKVSESDANVADPGSEKVILLVEQPFSNHNGGDLAFGPDGYLYIGLGDGGSGGDPRNYSQNPMSLLGKMLRIDVDNGDPYAIPEDNPYAQSADTLPEIWAMGLRNPWRYSFDALNGNLWISDVGQNAREEVNMVPPVPDARYNFGWRCYEGSLPYNTAGCEDSSFYTFPVFEYPQDQGDRSITGGYVYRGEEFDFLKGVYLCADFVSGKIYTVSETNGQFSGKEQGRFGEFQLATFGQNSRNDLFVAARGTGTIFRITEKCQSYIPLLTILDDTLSLELQNAAFDPERIDVTWYRDSMPVITNSDSVFTVDESGFYFAIITVDGQDCVLRSNEVWFEASNSVDNINKALPFALYPNPASQRLAIRMETSSDAQATVKFIRWDGTVRLTHALSPNEEVDLHTLTPGIYLVEIRQGGKTGYKRLVKI